MRLRKNRLSIEKVGDSVRMSDRLGVEKGGQGKARERASVKQGLDRWVCGTERGTLHGEHRGGMERDMRNECVERMLSIHIRARAITQRLFWWYGADKENWKV